MHHAKDRSSLNVFLTAQYYTGIFDVAQKDIDLQDHEKQERDKKRSELLKNHPANACLKDCLAEIDEEQEEEDKDLDSYFNTAGNH